MIDRSQLLSLAGDDPGPVIEILEDFLVEARSSITGLPLLDEKDARHLFHQLTGPAGSLGLSALSDLCREFEGKGVELGESLVQLLTELVEKSAVEAREVLSLNRPGE